MSSFDDENVDVRVRLVGRRQFQTDAAATAADINKIEKSTDLLANAQDKSAKRGFPMNQALFTARRLLYGLTAAITAATASFFVMGLQFNATMENNTVAMSFLLGSTEKATAELNTLYDLAATTPFSFADITDAARRFLAFGFSVDDTNRYLSATADAIAALGGDQTIIPRVVRAFGQISAKGRLMGQELLQLTEAGIPAFRYLRQELGLTGKQIQNIGRLGIPAKTAIDAIVRGMEGDPARGGFGGAADLLQNTVTGQLNTIKDYADQLFGTILTAPFRAIRESLPRFSSTLREMTEAMKNEGFMAMVRVIDEHIGGNGRLIMTINWLIGVLGSLKQILMEGVWPALWANAKIIGMILMPFLWALSEVLKLVADISSGWLAPAIMGLTFIWMEEYTALKLVCMWTKYLIFKEKMLVFWRAANVRIAKIQVFLTSAQALVMMRLVAATILTILWMKVLTFTTWLLNAALWANPITWVVLAFVALIAIVVVAIKYWGAITKAVQWTWDKLKAFAGWMKDHWYLFGPAGWVAKGIDVAKGIIPGLAEGGTVMSPGTVLVGERGPEMLTLPRGATVTPLSVNSLSAQGGGVMNIQIYPATIEIDGREIAEVVFNHRLDRIARA